MMFAAVAVVAIREVAESPPGRCTSARFGTKPIFRDQAIKL
jgi:hypothetical protein